MDGDVLTQLARRLRASSRVTVLTGAGVSAASGVPTFRGADGLWEQRRPEDLATARAFGEDPEAVWAWYAWRRARVAACQPNPAHVVLAGWSARMPQCRVITQNVDDLHVRAGTERLVRLHGSLWELSCFDGCPGGTTPWRDDTASDTRLRRCPYCGGVARPAVVWFGESLDPGVVAEARRASACDTFVTIGTSAVVYPAAGLVQQAKRRGAFTVEINPEATPATQDVDLVLAEAAEAALPAIDARLLEMA